MEQTSRTGAYHQPPEDGLTFFPSVPQTMYHSTTALQHYSTYHVHHNLKNYHAIVHPRARNCSTNNLASKNTDLNPQRIGERAFCDEDVISIQQTGVLYMMVIEAQKLSSGGQFWPVATIDTWVRKS